MYDQRRFICGNCLGYLYRIANFCELLRLLALQWRVFEALLYSVRTDLRLVDPAVAIFNACSSSVLNFRCYGCSRCAVCVAAERRVAHAVLFALMPSTRLLSLCYLLCCRARGCSRCAVCLTPGAPSAPAMGLVMESDPAWTARLPAIYSSAPSLDTPSSIEPV